MHDLMHMRCLLILLFIFGSLTSYSQNYETKFLTEIFEEIIESDEQSHVIRNVEIRTDNLLLESLSQYLEGKYDSNQLKSRHRKIVISKDIRFENVLIDPLELDNIIFEGRFEMINASPRENVQYSGWVDILGCEFNDLLLDENTFLKLTLNECTIHSFNMLDNRGRDGINFFKSEFTGKTLFRDNADDSGIFFYQCTFHPTAGDCLAKSDSLTYGRHLTQNVQFIFTSSGIGNHPPVNIRLEDCHFIENKEDTLSQKVVIRSPNIASLRIEGNTFGSTLDLNGSVVENKLILRNNTFKRFIVFNELILSEVFNIFYWDQFKGEKIAVYEELPREHHCEERFGFKSVLYLAKTEKELANSNSYEQLINAYHTLFSIARTRGDIDGSNGVYVEMKDIMTRRYKYLYGINQNFETYFKWKLNEFLYFFTDYGTKPGKAVEKSIWVILIFAAFYFLFPSEWNVMGRKSLISKINLLIAYFKSERTLFDNISRKKPAAEEYQAFKATLNESRYQVPGYIYLMGKPLIEAYDFIYRFEDIAYRKFEIMSGKWVDLTPTRKWITASVIGFFFLMYLLFTLLIRTLNAVTLSVNAFTTLGFGIIPTRGLARYVAIVQGFIGWFLLSIFIVALINQVLA